MLARVASLAVRCRPHGGVHPVDREWLILGTLFLLWAPTCVCIVAWLADR
jgi:hypothetical protein